MFNDKDLGTIRVSSHNDEYFMNKNPHFMEYCFKCYSRCSSDSARIMVYLRLCWEAIATSDISWLKKLSEKSKYAQQQQLV